MKDNKRWQINRIFEIKLRPDPFNRIYNGDKTIEYRLHDEKKSLLNKGDYIRFTEIVDEERTLLVEIVDIFTAPSFVALEQKFVETGLLDKGSFSPIGMREYYSAEAEEKYGVMGIRIRVVNSVALDLKINWICSHVLWGEICSRVVSTFKASSRPRQYEQISH